MKKLALLLILSIFIFLGFQSASDKDPKIAITVSFSNNVSTKNLDGRVLLMLSTNNDKEPRFQIGVGLKNQLVYGMNASTIKPIFLY